jgi:DNA-binding MarR family transcriptional regulator
VLDDLARTLDDERAPARGYPPPLAAAAVVNGVLGVLEGRLAEPNPGTLVELGGALMSFIVLPFLGVRAARRELARPPAVAPVPVKPSVTLDLLQDPGKALNHHRTLRVLLVIGTHPGLNNKGVARYAGVKDEGQASRLLSRLERLGLIENLRDVEATNAKAWRLTANGHELQAAAGRQPAASAKRSSTLDHPRDFARRMNHRTVSVLRLIAAEPGLSNAEVADRLGVKAKSHTSRLLARLASRGLIENTVAAGLPFEANAWQLTESGRERERAIPDEERLTAFPTYPIAPRTTPTRETM